MPTSLKGVWAVCPTDCLPLPCNPRHVHFDATHVPATYGVWLNAQADRIKPACNKRLIVCDRVAESAQIFFVHTV